DDANAESGARWQGLDQTMHSCRRKVHWVGTRIWGDWVECFHHRPSIPNPSTEIYSNGKTRDTYEQRICSKNPGMACKEYRDFLSASVCPRIEYDRDIMALYEI